MSNWESPVATEFQNRMRGAANQMMRGEDRLLDTANDAVRDTLGELWHVTRRHPFWALAAVAAAALVTVAIVKRDRLWPR